ncbi:hypothetical protein RN001_015608 [Aquatica leii]|uniref:Endonuclease-reverse transcriptase n=1 Tax=Aquatica leii TaxID=1421715 RepID=A0AAN7SAZ1_9COLE|nr:hypothetical protein RN001_015608 [Aquatica leii]
MIDSKTDIGILKNSSSRLLATEMQYWRKSCGLVRTDRIRNIDIRKKLEVERNIIEEVEKKQLIWYGHVQKMEDERWPKKTIKWVPPERRKRGRPKKKWIQEMETAKAARGLEDEE